MWVFPKIGVPQIIHFNRVSLYKPSILGYHYLWKHLCIAVLQDLYIFIHLDSRNCMDQWIDSSVSQNNRRIQRWCLSWWWRLNSRHIEFDSPNVITRRLPKCCCCQPQRTAQQENLLAQTSGFLVTPYSRFETVSGFPWPMGPPMKCWKRDVNFCWIGRSWRKSLLANLLWYLYVFKMRTPCRCWLLPLPMSRRFGEEMANHEEVLHV